MYRVKNESRELAESSFQHVFFASYTSLTSSKCLLKLLSTHAYFIAWLESIFTWKKKATIPILYFKKIKELNERKCEKEFLLYINFDSNCLSVNI